MEWIEANPLPEVCQKCEADFKRYQEADEAEKLRMEEQGFFFDCGSCDHGGERFYLSRKDELTVRRKGLVKAIERLERQIREIVNELKSL
jgi:hypothetical protein